MQETPSSAAWRSRFSTACSRRRRRLVMIFAYLGISAPYPRTDSCFRPIDTSFNHFKCQRHHFIRFCRAHFQHPACWTRRERFVLIRTYLDNPTNNQRADSDFSLIETLFNEHKCRPLRGASNHFLRHAVGKLTSVRRPVISNNLVISAIFPFF